MEVNVLYIIYRISTAACRRPAIIEVITTIEKVDELKALINSETIAALLKLDYSRYMGVIVFQGFRGVGPRAININQVRYDGRVVYLHSTFTEPGEIKTMLTTSPYHVIKIQKPPGIGDNWWTTFILYDKGRKVAVRRAIIPEAVEPPAVISPLSPLKNKEKEE